MQGGQQNPNAWQNKIVVSSSPGWDEEPDVAEATAGLSNLAVVSVY